MVCHNVRLCRLFFARKFLSPITGFFPLIEVIFSDHYFFPFLQVRNLGGQDLEAMVHVGFVQGGTDIFQLRKKNSENNSVNSWKFVGFSPSKKLMTFF